MFPQIFSKIPFFSLLFRSRDAVLSDILAHKNGKRYYKNFHSLRREKLDSDVIKVASRLGRHGYKAYLVGGSIRDLLLGRKPKDFDVVTSATPNQIRRIFSNSRIIGRRFKLVHLNFGRFKVIETSTFRTLPSSRMSSNFFRKDFLLRDDNNYGSPQEDAARRDFTMNALLFDVRNESIIDYVDGFKDIENKVLRVIGDPNLSMKEDPVRMLRAAKFAALLGFTLEANTAKAIRANVKSIRKANKSRLWEELVKIFRTIKSADIFSSMTELGITSHLFANGWSSSKNIPFKETRVGKRFVIADKLVMEGEELSICIYLALFYIDRVLPISPTIKERFFYKYAKSKLQSFAKDFMIPMKYQLNLMNVFLNQHIFLEKRVKQSSYTDKLRKKDFFYEAFMVFKIIALAEKNEEDIQKTMFWEIGPRISLKEEYQRISLFRKKKKETRNIAHPSKEDYMNKKETR